MVQLMLAKIQTMEVANSEWVDCYNNAKWNGAINVSKDLDNESGRR